MRLGGVERLARGWPPRRPTWQGSHRSCRLPPSPPSLPRSNSRSWKATVSVRARNGSRRLRDGPRGLPPPRTGNGPRTPGCPRQWRAVAPRPPSRARLPRGQQEREPPGGGPRRPPAAGRPQAAAGARLAADPAARELRAPSSGGGAGGGGRGAAGPSRHRARRDRPGRAARRAGERARRRRTPGTASPPSRPGAPVPRGPFEGFRGLEELFPGRKRCEWAELGRRSPGPLAGSCPHTVLTRLHPQRHLGGVGWGGEGRGLAGPGVLTPARGGVCSWHAQDPRNQPLPNVFCIFLPYRKLPVGVGSRWRIKFPTDKGSNSLVKTHTLF